MTDRHLTCLRRVQRWLLVAVAVSVGTGSAFLAWDAWRERSVAVDLALTPVAPDDWRIALQMDWLNRRDCDYIKGSLKFVNNDPDDDLTPREFIDIEPFERRGSRGVGPQMVKLYVTPPETWSRVFYVVAAHVCGDIVVRSQMGVFKTEAIFPEEIAE